MYIFSIPQCLDLTVNISGCRGTRTKNDSATPTQATVNLGSDQHQIAITREELLSAFGFSSHKQTRSCNTSTSHQVHRSDKKTARFVKKTRQVLPSSCKETYKYIQLHDVLWCTNPQFPMRPIPIKTGGCQAQHISQPPAYAHRKRHRYPGINPKTSLVPSPPWA
jgi:hypothetical protein